MRLIVTDANIFIDMEVGGLLEDMFRLEAWEFVVPDILYVEELAQAHGQLPGLGLKVLPLEPALIREAVAFRQRYPRPSINDLLALVLAKAQGCPLLSGDSSLGAAAKAEAVEVHGTVWLMEVLASELAIDPDRIEVAYERMRAEGRRLPWSEVTKQINRWKNK